MTPTLNTERLVLRGWNKDDFPLFATFKADTEKNQYSIGGAADRVRAWGAFTAMCGEWALSNYGMFAVQKQNDPTAIGYAGIWFPPDIEEPELAWALFEGNEGKGFATEAAIAAKLWAQKTFGWGRLMSFIHPENSPSIALAERMGATKENETVLRGEPRLVFRHT